MKAITEIYRLTNSKISHSKFHECQKNRCNKSGLHFTLKSHTKEREMNIIVKVSYCK